MSETPKFEDTEEIVAGAPSFDETLDVETVESPVPQEMSQPEAFGLGAVEGLPFAKDAASAVSAAVDTFADEDYSIQEFKEKYDQELDGWNDQINEAERTHPGTFLAGDIVGGIAPMLIPGVGASLQGVRGAVTFGALSGLSRSEDRGITDALSGGALGFLGQKVGEKVGAGIVKVGKSVGKKAAGFVGVLKNKMSSGDRVKLVEHAERFYPSKSIDESINKFGKELLDTGILNESTNIETLARKAGTAKKVVQRVMDEAIDAVDNINASKVAQEGVPQPGIFDSEEVFRGLTQTVQDFFEDKTEQEFTKAQAKIMARLKNRLPIGVDEKGNPLSKKMNLKQLNNWRKDLDSIINFTSKNPNASTTKSIENNALKAVVGKLRTAIDDVMDSTLKNSDDEVLKAVKAPFRAAKRKYAGLNLIEDVMSNDVKKDAGGGFSRVMGDMANMRRAMLFTGLSGSLGLPAAVLATGIDVALTSKRAPLVMAKGLKTLSKYLTANPESAVSKKLVRAIANSDVSHDYLDSIVASSMAHASLVKNPLDRSNDSLIKNANAISTLLRNQDENLAKEFNSAVVKQDPETLGQIGNVLSQIPDAEEYIQPGEGWNGKYYSDDEKATANDRLETGDMSYSQELFHKAALKKNGTIPQVQKEQDRFLQYKSNKNKEPRI